MASKKPSGLGRGLGALLGDDVMKPEAQGTLTLPISDVESNSSQPRKYFDEAALAELADSIRQHGIIQPLTVRKLSSGYYQIIAGERRWRAARLAGLREVPVTVIEADDKTAAELAMIENLQREDLNPIEEAVGYRVLIQQYHMTQEEAANRVGKSRSAVTNVLRLLDLDPAVQKLVETGLLSALLLVVQIWDAAQSGRSGLHRRGPEGAGFPAWPRRQDRHRQEKGSDRAGILRHGRSERSAGGSGPA